MSVLPIASELEISATLVDHTCKALSTWVSLIINLLLSINLLQPFTKTILHEVCLIFVFTPLPLATWTDVCSLQNFCWDSNGFLFKSQTQFFNFFFVLLMVKLHAFS